MQSIFHPLKRTLIALADTVAWPFRGLRELWFDAQRGRYLVFGIPSILIGFLAVSAALFAGTASKKSFIKRYENARDAAVAAKRWPEAITFARKLVELQAENDDVKLDLAKILGQDDTESKNSSRRLAEAIFTSLAPADEAGHPDAHVRQAQIILRASANRVSPAPLIKLAEDHINFALAVEPDHKDAKTLLAEVHVWKKNFPEAERIYRELFKDHVGFYVKIVEVMRRQNRAIDAAPVVQEAVTRYQELLKESPDHINYLRRLANCYSMLEEFDKGAVLLNEAIDRIDNVNGKKALTRTLSNLYMAKSHISASKIETDENERRTYLDNVIEAYRCDQTNDQPRIALTMFALKGFPESPEALAVYDGRQNPQEAPDGVLQQLGTREIMNGDVNMGISLLETALEKNPRNHQVLNNLAFALMESDINRAKELADQAVTLAPRQPNYRDTRGNILKRLGQYDKAIIDLENAMIHEQMKDNISLFESLVECYQARGMMSEAASYQTKVDELRRKKLATDELNSNGN